MTVTRIITAITMTKITPEVIIGKYNEYLHLTYITADNDDSNENNNSDEDD